MLDVPTAARTLQPVDARVAPGLDPGPMHDGAGKGRDTVISLHLA